MLKIALVGNPNCGKTTVFNLLTGGNQKVGNWPGVTVEKKFGFFEINDKKFELVDLPEIYSLEQNYYGVDESIALDYLNKENIDLVINLIDATNLERGLVLTQQLLEKPVPVLLALNMMDVAKQQGISISPETLSDKLQTQLVSLTASKSEGINELHATILKISSNSNVETTKSTFINDEDEVEEKVLKRYHNSKKLVDGAVEIAPIQHSLSEKIDSVVLNRWLGVPFFLLMIYLMFTFAVNVGAIFIDFFDILFAAFLIDGASWLLQQISVPDIFIILLADGVGGGITLVATFIPVIGFLYLSLSVLEDSG